MKKSLVFLLLISTLFGFSLGVFFNEDQHKNYSQPDNIDFSLFWEAYNIIENRFIDKQDIDTEEIVYGAISGAMKTLNDPYTIFFNPEDSKRFLENIKGTFEGVGMEIAIKENQLTVVTPLEGTPAQKAGLKPKDAIMKIDGKNTTNITIDEAVDLIRGPRGTKVSLTIFRGENKTIEIEVERGIIEIPSLKWELISTSDNQKIAYLELYHFSEKASLDFKKAAKEILDSPAEKIILDLRNNPGGYLSVAQDIAGWFLEKDEIVVIEDFGEKEEKKEYLSRGPSTFSNYPLIILINQGSASAAEILAGALRDNRGIKLVGEISFGKGSVQQLKKLSDGSSLKITISKWLTPKHKLINEIGLEPDVKIEIEEQDIEQEKDPQLEKAIELIQELK